MNADRGMPHHNAVPVKSCPLDPVPTFLVRELVDFLLPYLMTMVNKLLIQGQLPLSQKEVRS